MSELRWLKEHDWWALPIALLAWSVWSMGVGPTIGWLIVLALLVFPVFVCIFSLGDTTDAMKDKP